MAEEETVHFNACGPYKGYSSETLPGSTTVQTFLSGKFSGKILDESYFEHNGKKFRYDGPTLALSDVIDGIEEKKYVYLGYDSFVRGGCHCKQLTY